MTTKKDTKIPSFTTRFLEPVAPNGGPHVWESNLGWGRYQAGNNELAPNCHAKTDKGTNPHPIIGGVRHLRAEKVVTYDNGRKFDFSAAMMTTRLWRAFRYGYFNLRAIVKPEHGVTPAYWFMPADLTRRYPELDIFEFFNGDPMHANIHMPFFGKGQQFQQPFKFLPDGKPHDYGFNWTRERVQWRVDGEMMVDLPNTFLHEHMYPLFNVAVGLGLAWAKVKAFNPPPGWHNDMALVSFDVWQEPEDIVREWPV